MNTETPNPSKMTVKEMTRHFLYNWPQNEDGTVDMSEGPDGSPFVMAQKARIDIRKKMNCGEEHADCVIVHGIMRTLCDTPDKIMQMSGIQHAMMIAVMPIVKTEPVINPRVNPDSLDADYKKRIELALEYADEFVAAMLSTLMASGAVEIYRSYEDAKSGTGAIDMMSENEANIQAIMSDTNPHLRVTPGGKLDVWQGMEKDLKKAIAMALVKMVHSTMAESGMVMGLSFAEIPTGEL